MLAFAQLAAADPRFKVQYVIPHADQRLEDASPLGWYTPGLHDAAEPLMLASSLPADIREPFTDRGNMLVLRLVRNIWPLITPLQLDAIPTGEAIFQTPFRVYITNLESVADALDNLLEKSRIPYLHVSSVTGRGRISVRGFGRRELLQYVTKVLQALEDDAEWSLFVAEARKVLVESDLQQPTPHTLPTASHNVTKPNEVALTAFGWLLDKEDALVKEGKRPPVDARQYIARICQGADAVLEERKKLLAHKPILADHRYILAVPGVYWGHYDRWRERIGALEKPHRRLAKLAYIDSIRQKTYFKRLEVLPEEKAETVLKAIMALGAVEAADMRSFTAGLAYLAAASLAPVFRLEPRLNECRGDVKLLAHSVRTPGKKRVRWKQSRLARCVSSKMRSLVDGEFLARIDRVDEVTTEGMKLVTDLPLEWMLSNGMPLGLRFDVSRIPVVPGNVYLAMCVAPPAILPSAAFGEILVVRSFAEDDPLRKLVEESPLDEKTEGKLPVRVRFADVSSEDELVGAVNSFTGACMVFDGHGAYDANDGSGSIVIAGKPINAWKLRGRCHFPPIVMLSACDTQPLDGSHTSTAIGAFVLGARTVLGTSLPIDGVAAASFIHRMLLRIREYVPLAVEHFPVTTWRNVVSGMLRMTHVSDIVRTLHAEKVVQLGVEDRSAIQLAANSAISQRRSNWYDVFLQAYATRTGISADELRRLIQQWAGVTESMKYVQLGSPENVVIVKEPPDEVFLREANRADSFRSNGSGRKAI